MNKNIKKRSLLLGIGNNSQIKRYYDAWANDYDFDTVFERQIEAHAISGGVCWGISTSGNSKNIVKAFKAAQNLEMKTIGLTGKGGGMMKKYSDILIDVPSKSTPRIQELHLPIYHYICEKVEQYKKCT